ncbi:MAG TPA: phage holin family protein [Streptosporangiaceae bacterium]|nr:phage holin family protein [Streptosporangiaceae bacterium]
MADTAVRGQADTSHASVGDLVALAVSDLTQLVKCEVDLAKLELKSDARRLGIGAVLLGMAAFVGCLVLMLLCFAFAYGLMALGIWGWAAFLIVAGACILLAVLAVAIGFTRFRKLSGLRQTRGTVSDDLALIRRDDSATATGPAKTR